MTFLSFLLLVALPPTMPVDAIHPGQHGTCQTVFEGDVIEPFAFEVKGLMRHFLGPHKDLILVRLSGVKAEFTGVAAGMSGSPCTIDGKLIGALSYAFSTFAKEPIAGITPIASMLEVMQLPDEARPWRLAMAPPPGLVDPYAGSRTAALRSASAADWEALRRGEASAAVSEGSPAGAQQTAAVEGMDQLRPIATPLTLGGVPPETVQQFMPWLRQAGFEPVVGAAGGGGDQADLGVPLVPGSAVSGVLIQGDMDMAATGTVTYVDHDMMLAFGHSFFGAGAVSIPMANATILNTMASALRSYKMSTTGPVVGEITQDRLTAIGGYMGRHPKRVNIRGVMTTLRGPAAFKLEVARDLAMTPRLVAMGISGALTGRVDAGQRGMMRVNSLVQVAHQAPVHLHNIYTADRDPGLFSSAGIDVARVFQALWDTPFGPPPDVKVDVEASFEAEPINELIEAIYTDRAQVRVGEQLEVAVRLRRRSQPIEVARFNVTIPRSWAGHTVGFAATGADGAERVVRDVSGAPRFLNYEQIVHYLDTQRPEGNVYLFAVRDGVSLHAATDTWSFIPPSTVAVMSGDPSKEGRTQGIAWEDRKPRPGIVDGLARTTVRVQKF